VIGLQTTGPTSLAVRKPSIMHRSSLAALLFALALCSSAFAQTTTPQFALVDLGPTTVAGSGLPWQVVQPTPAPSNFPSTASSQGTTCWSTETNEIYAEYGNEAVGTTCWTAIGPNWHAAMWDLSTPSSPKLTDLGVLPGANGGASTVGPISEANGFNNVGDIVGGSDTQYDAPHTGFSVAHHAFLYSNGVMTDLGSIAGQNYSSEANSVNDSHEIVGATNTISSVDGSVLSRAFLYTNSTMYNLTFYLVGGATVHLTNALWIDCQGNIAAVGTALSGGNAHAYLLVRQGAARSCPN
jgi:probable HAF family extracellular repeat protein